MNRAASFPAPGPVSLPQLADPRQLAAAFARLQPGASLLWARGPHPLGAEGNATQALVKGWVAEGRATTAQGRDPDVPGWWRHLVYRVAEAVTAPAAPVRRGPLDNPQWAESIEGRVYRLVAQCARLGQPCPTNAVLAEVLNLPGEDAAKYRFQLLVKQGLLRVVEPNRFGTRVVEVTASGLRTASAGEKVGG